MRPLIVLTLVTLLGIAGVIAVERLPPQHSPFAPIDLGHPVGFATGLKLSRLGDHPGACKRAVARSPLLVTAIPDRVEGGFCLLDGAVAIQRSSVRYSAPVRVTCPMAAALYLWERDVVAPAAARHLDARVARIDHAGTYACRRVSGSATGRPSQHARANAIDVSGFLLANGRRIPCWRTGMGVVLREHFCGRCETAAAGCCAPSSAPTTTRRTATISTWTWVHTDYADRRRCWRRWLGPAGSL